MTPNLILILGGARSGKSDYAEQLALQLGHQVLYIATAEAHDDDMADRIARHQAVRPAHWTTLETPTEVGPALETLAAKPDAVLLDCLTLLTSNILLADEAAGQDVIQARVNVEIDALIAIQHAWQVPLIIVSNEVGLGLVPPYKLGRIYRDVLGRANQRLARAASHVVFMVAGLPMMVKGERLASNRE